MRLLQLLPMDHPFSKGLPALCLLLLSLPACSRDNRAAEPRSEARARAKETIERGERGERDAEEHSVVLAGHLYSLYVQGKGEKPGPLVAWEDPVRSFVSELSRIEPEKIFLLGDNVRYGNEKEWEFLRSEFAPVLDRVQFLAGNHEFRNNDAFLAAGGWRNHSIVLHRNKYICLDAKTYFGEEDLAFIESEVADHESYDHVFILTHLFLAIWPSPAEPVEGDAAYVAYTGFSNWTERVVPLIAGKVDVVFTGDVTRMHLANMRQVVGETSIQYVSTSFLFGRGENGRSNDDGPMLFLELRFSGDEFAVIPRAVPLDARHDWYSRAMQSAPLPLVEGLTWRRHQLTNWGLSLAFPVEWVLGEDWTTGRPALDRLTLKIPGDVDWKVGELEIRRHALEPGAQREGSAIDELQSEWQRAIATEWGEIQFRKKGTFTILGKTGHVRRAYGKREGKEKVVWAFFIERKDALYTFTLIGPPSEMGRYQEQLSRALEGMEFAEG